MGRLIGAADIGSNTAHLLIADVNGTGLSRVVNESDWLSLGEVVSRVGEIPPESEERLFASLKRFHAEATRHRVTKLYVFATEAMRRARNHEKILDRIRQQIGLDVDIISPRREAELSLRGAAIDCPFDGPTALLEAGGGSVQVARSDGGTLTAESSLPIGTGALTARADLSQPATFMQVARVEEIVDEALEEIRDFEPVKRVVTCGGVARGIWRALHPDGERTLHTEELRFLAWDSRRLSVQQIVARYGVKAKRAATLLPGSILYQRILDSFAHDEMIVSEYGVREGAIMELASGKLKESRV